jgi:hypothetical protein
MKPGSKVWPGLEITVPASEEGGSPEPIAVILEPVHVTKPLGISVSPSKMRTDLIVKDILWGEMRSDTMDISLA